MNAAPGHQRTRISTSAPDSRRPIAGHEADHRQTQPLRMQSARRSSREVDSLRNRDRRALESGHRGAAPQSAGQATADGIWFVGAEFGLADIAVGCMLGYSI